MEDVCPLCCEELDLSDREFYPCKCGYQVCMWCWHRIRESESGLCPACRTPYGEDPHQFSAVDVEEVLKANKEKEERAKRERQKQQAAMDGGGPGGGGGDHEHPLSSHLAMEVPKDRTQLANMRVIRRNLVYAVGLPPGIASEDTLRKPEYFGQYGKISKIVLNRMQATTGDARRASASAYVTFVHKEDTLACILALDGFYLENRNIRASYGTSKYCSAFIKNVRCNNPDCTYLHEMGAAEDTFTKQEIQAGYVTSGRDVLARQQQIVAEQLRQGTHGSMPRKRVGGGGPSGSGKSCATPVFPPPEFDEPQKAPPTLVPTPSGATRAVSVGSVALNPANISAKLGRSTSVGSKSPPLAGIAAPNLQQRKSLGPIPAASAATSTAAAPTATTAASVVAGMHTTPKPEPTEPHTTLTTLTPLKRNAKAPKPAPSGAAAATSTTASGATVNGKKNGTKAAAQNTGSALTTSRNSSGEHSVIGGDVIGPAAVAVTAPANPRPPLKDALGGEPVPLDSLGSRTLPQEPESKTSHSSALGGEIFTGQLPNGTKTAIGSGKDKWNQNQVATGGNPLLSPSDPILGPSTKGLWDGGINAAPVGGSIIGSHSNGGPTSSSELAFMLGINLPTGSGSLQESTTLWPGPQRPSPLSTLNGSALNALNAQGGGTPMSGSVIGSSSLNSGGSAIGGVPIGGGRSSSTGTKSDVALLRRLLPGVHITSGSDSLGGGGWNAAPGAVGPSGLGGETWGDSAPRGSGAVGAIGGLPLPANHHQLSHHHHHQQMHHQTIHHHHHSRPQQTQQDHGIW